MTEVPKPQASGKRRIIPRMNTKAIAGLVITLLLAITLPTVLADLVSGGGCTRYFGWGSDPDGSAHCIAPGGVDPEGPLSVVPGEPVNFEIKWSDWHGGPHDFAIYIGTISGTISYPPYDVPYPKLVDSILLASWTNDIAVFADPPTVTGPHIVSAWYVASGTLDNYNPKILPIIDPTPYGNPVAFVFVENAVLVTIPPLPMGTYCIRILSTWTDGTIAPPPSPNDERVLGNPLITIWGWLPEVDPNGYPWGEYVDISVTVNPIPVEIDIKPYSYPNAINPENKGVIPVAVLSTATFDATTVLPDSTKFGPTGTEAAVHMHPDGSWHIEDKDVNLDGFIDRVFFFKTMDCSFDIGDTTGTLIGLTTDGVSVKGMDSVKIVPK